jgi:hypothetical protein
VKHCAQFSQPLVRAVCKDDVTVLALSVIRSIASGYMTSDVACWDVGFDGAERILGDVEGPRFVSAMAGLMRAIRAERQGDWTFLSATCCRVTSDELTLLSALDEAECNLPARCARLAQTSLAPRIERSVREAHAVLARTRKLIRPAGSELQGQHGLRLN